MVAPSLTDPFARQLYNKLADEIEQRVNNVATGSALIHGNVGIDAIATAMNYQKDIAYIQALQQVIQLCQELDTERYGRKTKDSDLE